MPGQVILPRSCKQQRSLCEGDPSDGCDGCDGPRRRKTARKSHYKQAAKKTLHWRNATGATTILERAEEQSLRVQQKLEKTIDLLEKSRNSYGSTSATDGDGNDSSVINGSNAAVCPCGKPKSRACRRGRCGGKNARTDGAETVKPERSARAIERQRKRDARRERLANRTTELTAKAATQRRKIARLTAKAVEVSAIVVEQRERACANKFQERVKSSCPGVNVRSSASSSSSSYLSSYLYSAAHQPQQHTGTGTGASRTNPGAIQEPILSEFCPIEARNCWFNPPLTGTDALAEAVSQLVSEPSFTDTAATCAVCTCELIEKSEDAPDADADADADAARAVDEIDEVDEVVSISTCSVKHFFHRSCISQALKYSTRCPECFTAVIPVVGPQPDGSMSVRVDKAAVCRGHEQVAKGAIVINYSFPSGVQDARHPNPGSPYSGTYRTAYLPNSKEGRRTLARMQVAFDRRLLFRVGTSLTTGLSNTVVWNSIHHKTTLVGGMFGYPDPTYLQRVNDELTAVGVE